MGDYIQDFRDLLVWQEGMKLTKVVYEVTRGFPDDERFGLVSQMRRTAVAIPSNIAEGYGRGTTQDYLRFLRIARGAAAELETQLLLSLSLGYSVGDGQAMELLKSTQRLLQGLIKSVV